MGVDSARIAVCCSDCTSHLLACGVLPDDGLADELLCGFARLRACDLKEHEGDLLSKAQIDRLLKGRVNHSTLNRILDYLEASNKIIQHPTKGIMWVYAEKSKIDCMLKDGLIV